MESSEDPRRFLLDCSANLVDVFAEVGIIRHNYAKVPETFLNFNDILIVYIMAEIGKAEIVIVFLQTTL